MKAPEMRYMSPQIQNELLDVMGKHVVIHDIVQDIKEAKLYSICADEVTSRMLAICVKFSSFSIWAYRVSALVRALEAYATGLPSCNRTAPSPCCEASQLTAIGFCGPIKESKCRCS